MNKRLSSNRVFHDGDRVYYYKIIPFKSGKWIGPFIVVGKIGNQMYSLKQGETKVDVHVKQMLPESEFRPDDMMHYPMPEIQTEAKSPEKSSSMQPQPSQNSAYAIPPHHLPIDTEQYHTRPNYYSGYRRATTPKQRPFEQPEIIFQPPPQQRRNRSRSQQRYAGGHQIFESPIPRRQSQPHRDEVPPGHRSYTPNTVNRQDRQTSTLKRQRYRSASTVHREEPFPEMQVFDKTFQEYHSNYQTPPAFESVGNNDYRDPTDAYYSGRRSLLPQNAPNFRVGPSASPSTERQVAPTPSSPVEFAIFTPVDNPSGSSSSAVPRPQTVTVPAPDATVVLEDSEVKAESSTRYETTPSISRKFFGRVADFVDSEDDVEFVELRGRPTNKSRKAVVHPRELANTPVMTDVEPTLIIEDTSPARTVTFAPDDTVTDDVGINCVTDNRYASESQHVFHDVLYTIQEEPEEYFTEPVSDIPQATEPLHEVNAQISYADMMNTPVMTNNTLPVAEEQPQCSVISLDTDPIPLEEPTPSLDDDHEKAEGTLEFLAWYQDQHGCLPPNMYVSPQQQQELAHRSEEQEATRDLASAYPNILRQNQLYVNSKGQVSDRDGNLGYYDEDDEDYKSYLDWCEQHVTEMQDTVFHNVVSQFDSQYLPDDEKERHFYEHERFFKQQYDDIERSINTATNSDTLRTLIDQRKENRYQAECWRKRRIQYLLNQHPALYDVIQGKDQFHHLDDLTFQAMAKTHKASSATSELATNTLRSTSLSLSGTLRDVPKFID